MAAPASTALAQDEPIDNGAVAINEQDGSSEIDVAFDIRRVLDGIVDQTNAAVAYSSCQECQTIAIAIQVVLVNNGPVEVLTPENLAVAINEGCLTCVTVALAYQFVLGEPTKLRFTGEAQRRLTEIARALRELESSGGSAQEAVDEVNRIMTDLGDVLATGLTSAGPPRDEDDENRDDQEDGAIPRRRTRRTPARRPRLRRHRSRRARLRPPRPLRLQARARPPSRP